MEKQFLKNGFVKENEDPMFHYKKELLSKEEVEELDIREDEIPCLLYGNTPMNSGFCIYAGEYFIWLNVETPKEASELAEKIVSFESV